MVCFKWTTSGTPSGYTTIFYRQLAPRETITSLNIEVDNKSLYGIGWHEYNSNPLPIQDIISGGSNIFIDFVNVSNGKLQGGAVSSSYVYFGVYKFDWVV